MTPTNYTLWVPYFGTPGLLHSFPNPHNTENDVDYLGVARTHHRHTGSLFDATIGCGDMAVKIKVRPARDGFLDEFLVAVGAKECPARLIVPSTVDTLSYSKPMGWKLVQNNVCNEHRTLPSTTSTPVSLLASYSCAATLWQAGRSDMSKDDTQPHDKLANVGGGSEAVEIDLEGQRGDKGEFGVRP